MIRIICKRLSYRTVLFAIQFQFEYNLNYLQEKSSLLVEDIRESELWTTPQHERVRLTTGPDISSATPTLSPNPPTIATTCSCSSLCSSKVFEMLSNYQKKWPLPISTRKTINDRHNVVLLFKIVLVIRNM